MKEEPSILQKVNRRDGMTVPDGYFTDFAARMAQSLETTPFEQSASPTFVAKPRTAWQRVRPYVYMAAMFAGVWCMLKMFTMLTATTDGSQWQPTPVMAEALGNEVFVNEYILDDLNQWDLIDEMMEDGFDVETLNYYDADDSVTDEYLPL